MVTAVTAALMALSSSAMAVQTQPKPVDKLQQLINTSESNQKRLPPNLWRMLKVRQCQTLI
nr:hypothetical protein [Psychrobacter sp. PraFG1]UNK06201.1 hypothetical protein MN210_06290 [Psychrobacter sp. PraFG1]